ncbi:hypothetical protein NXS98_06230 [Fontisphaera persica]|uniref:hypothetical protein n=1 Tax=Fontisphaera persica TaxID=2974023 RepID=UPI0024C037AA|nr:hypothetical protein [Fontisphaera persica]WCJ60722.1 hypothetical protein NXS98_06230 [Fontisphaera persica]
MSNTDQQLIVQQQSKEIVEVARFETQLLTFLKLHDLPHEGILAGIEERKVNLDNIARVVRRIPHADRLSAVYLSKYVSAVATGLFDAALNYLWDETIIQLRTRVAQYDLSYFYDNAVSSEERRKHLKDASDLDKISDDELIRGAHAIGLIGEIGFKHLDYIRFMRNWVSAAHPNQNEITGLQLLSWLETCAKEVITLPLSNATVEIKSLLGSIKTTVLDEKSAKEIGVFFANLTQEQVDSLAAGLFGIYTRNDTSPSTRDNIHKLIPTLWLRVSEATRGGFGVKYGKFVASNDQGSKNLAHQFLALVGGLQYLPEDLKAVQLEEVLTRLLTVHNAMNNFYNEPAFAQELANLVGSHGAIPSIIAQKYVRTLVYVYLTNGNGVAWAAEPVYLKLIEQFDIAKAMMAVLAFEDPTIASRLQFKLCRDKYMELLTRMKQKAALPAMAELIDFLTGLQAPPDKWRLDSRVTNKVKALQPLLEAAQ